MRTLAVLWCSLLVTTVLADTLDIKLEMRVYTVQELLKTVENQLEVRFSYSDQVVNLSKIFQVRKEMWSLEELLKTILLGQSVGYELRGNKVILYRQSTRGQRKVTVSGYVKSDLGEALIGVNIIDQTNNSGTSTNIYGFFSYTLETDRDIQLRVHYLGHQDSLLWISPDHQGILDVRLHEQKDELEEVLVETSRFSPTQMSVLEINPKEIKSLPSFMGVPDVVKTMTLMPGVKSGNDNSGGFYVRGGGPDQNLVLVDGAVIYNSAHAFDLFSTFNPDAVRHVDMMKGGFPARYGGRLSSVLDLRLREGNSKRLTGEFGLGYLLSNFTLEGPLIKDKSSFLMSGRRTFIDLPFRLGANSSSVEGQTQKQFIVFQDLTAKVNHKFSDKDHLFVSYYGSGDSFEVEEKNEFKQDGADFMTELDVSIQWNNRILASRWNHLFSDQLFLNTSLTYSRFNIGIDVFNASQGKGVNSSSLNKFDSQIEDVSLRAQFDYFPTTNHNFKFGVNTIHHQFRPGVGSAESSIISNIDALDTTFSDQLINSYEHLIFAEDEIVLPHNFKANVGVHASALVVNGKIYPSLQPRVSVQRSFGNKFGITLSYASMAQYVHLLTNGTLGIPLDLWVPAMEAAPPMTSHQLAFGLNRSTRLGYRFSFEAYYKEMNNLVTYKEGANFTDAQVPWQEKIIIGGHGYAYGFEWLVRKTKGKTTGWIGYTLSWTNRQFNEIDKGAKFPYKYDRRHDGSVVLLHRLSKKIELSGSWVYSTGNALTFPVGAYEGLSDLPNLGKNGVQVENSQSIEVYENKNSLRMPAYHRLDVGFNFIKKKKNGVRTWNFSVYNAYVRKNPFFIYVQQDEPTDGSLTENPRRELYQVSSFWIVPSVSYRFKFN